MSSDPLPPNNDHPTLSNDRKREKSPILPLDPKKKPASRTNVQRAVTYLEDTNRIGNFEQQAPDFTSYVVLNTTRIFRSLTDLYKIFFNSHQDYFEPPLRGLIPSEDVSTKTGDYLARVYVSHWFYDQYYWIRKSIRKIDPIGAQTYYSPAISSPYAMEWDPFLSCLSAAIRPTKINLIVGTTIFVPILDDKMDITEEANPLPSVPSGQWLFNPSILGMIFRVFKARKVCQLTPVSTETFGRPSWLFDWKVNDSIAYAWFPQEGNYNTLDVAIAYILGVACTPLLGICECDNARLFDYTANFTTIPASNYPRVMKSRIKGNVLYTTFAVQLVCLPDYYQKDETQFKASNTGPLALVVTGSEKDFVSITAASESSSSGTIYEVSPESIMSGKFKENFNRVTPTTTEKWGFLLQRRDYYYFTEVLRSVSIHHRMDSLRKMIALD